MVHGNNCLYQVTSICDQNFSSFARTDRHTDARKAIPSLLSTAGAQVIILMSLERRPNSHSHLHSHSLMRSYVSASNRNVFSLFVKVVCQRHLLMADRVASSHSRQRDRERRNCRLRNLSASVRWWTGECRQIGALSLDGSERPEQECGRLDTSSCCLLANKVIDLHNNKCTSIAI